MSNGDEPTLDEIKRQFSDALRAVGDWRRKARYWENLYYAACTDPNKAPVDDDSGTVTGRFTGDTNGDS